MYSISSEFSMFEGIVPHRDNPWVEEIPVLRTS